MGAHSEDPAARLKAQYALVRRLAQAPTPEGVVHQALRVIGEFLGWPVGAAWLADREAGVLRRMEHREADGIVADGLLHSGELTFPRGVGLPGRVWESGRPALIADLGADPNFPRAQQAEAIGLRAGLALPIHARGGTVGVLEFFTPDVQELDQDLLDLLWAFGRLIGQELERREVDARLRAGEALSAAVIGAALDCVVVMDHEGRITHFNPAAERTFGRRREDVVGRELAEMIVPPELREAHRSALRRLVAGGPPRILNQRLELESVRADGSRFPAELAITRIGDAEPPLFAGFVRDITGRRAAAAEVTELLRREHAARVRAEAAERRARQVAVTLQRSLLPPVLPEVPGFELGAAFRAGGEGLEVGGDFYDVFATPDGRWACVLGDVCGKGAPAAAVAALARFTVRAAAVHQQAPSAVLRQLNEALLAETEHRRFCSAVYAAFCTGDGGNGRLELAVAGHPSPLVVRADGTVEEIGRPGTLLGIVDAPQLADAETRLGPGDAVVLYTDGVTEARTADGRFGTDRLVALLQASRDAPAAQIASRIEATVADDPAHRRPDDLAVLVLRLRGRESRPGGHARGAGARDGRRAAPPTPARA